MPRVSCFVGLVLVSTFASAQPPPPPPMIIDMPVVQGVAMPMPQMPPRDGAQPAKPGTATLRR